jgi:hypothetical protein
VSTFSRIKTDRLIAEIESELEQAAAERADRQAGALPQGLRGGKGR